MVLSLILSLLMKVEFQKVKTSNIQLLRHMLISPRKMKKMASTISSSKVTQKMFFQISKPKIMSIKENISRIEAR